MTLMYENYFFKNILWKLCTDSWASLMAQEIKNLPAVSPGYDRRHGSDPWVMKICWRRKWQPTPVSLPGKSHGQRSLASYSHGITNSRIGLSTQWMDGILIHKVLLLYFLVKFY